MAKQNGIKTNVMRILEKEGIAYHMYEYPHENDAVDGMAVAQLLGQDPNCVFKTLVARGKSGSFHVFCIPVSAELDLKKAAQAAKEKSVALVHVKELLPLTGYVRGGCSPIGMKKAFSTVLHETAREIPEIIVSAGKIGFQVALAPEELRALVHGNWADIIA